MTDLFAREPGAPLAERLRPHTLDDVVGQEHLIGEGKPLRVAVESGKPHSMLLWGAAGRGQDDVGADFGAEFQCPVFACFRRVFRREGHTRGNR